LVYRHKEPYGENSLLQRFRDTAALSQLTAGIDREAIDLWLYVARHAGLPTRLLDWSEGALIALYFAVRKDRPARVWMLVPMALNSASGVDAYETPWDLSTRTAAAIRAAWGVKPSEVLSTPVAVEAALPIALYPMHVHPRLQVQQSCFTIHGRQKQGLQALMEEVGLSHYLHAIDIDPSSHATIRTQLRILGISQSSLFPDLDGLAGDLAASHDRHV